MRTVFVRMRIACGFVILLGGVAGAAPPPNDECINAIVVTAGVPYEGTTVGATGTTPSLCGTKDQRDVWHRFTASLDGYVLVSLCGSDFDTTLAIYDGCGGTELACNDDLCGLQSEIVMPMSVGVAYWIRIAGHQNGTGHYTLTVTEDITLPSHDACEDAIEVLLNTPYIGSTTAATGDFDSTCGYYDTRDVWHFFVPASTDYYRVSLCNSDFDTTLAVYDGCGGVELACSDDGCGRQSEVVVEMTAGYMYLVRVAGYDGSTGDYILTVTPTTAPPVNDLCEDAVDVVPGTPYIGSTTGATGSFWSSCSYNDVRDVWHRVTPGTTDNYLISLCDSAFDTTLVVYDQCGPERVELACNDDSCGVQSEMVVPLTGGETYTIRVAGYDGDTGDYILSLTGSISPPANDDCINAIEVLTDTPTQGTTTGATGVEVSGCSELDTLDVWHTFQPLQNGEYLISLCGSSFDTTLAVYDGCEGMELACNDDSCDRQSELQMSLSAGQTYYLRIAGYRGASGDYTLTVTETVCDLPEAPEDPVPGDGAEEVPTDTLLYWDNGPSLVQSVEIERIEKVIYGADDRLDEYQVSDPVRRLLGDGTVVLLDLGDLTNNGDGTFSVPAESLAEWYERVYGRPLCPDEPYWDQPNPGVCSGFLLGPDMVVTAGHCINDTGECANTAFIFDFAMQDATTPVLTIDADQVYFCSEIIQRKQTADSDWALIRLDRPVSDHMPLPIRHQNIIADNKDVFVIGHPLGLPRKYAGGAIVRDNSAASYFSANLDTYMASSGSPVFNADTLKVEGLVFNGNLDFVQDGGCDRSQVCPDATGCPLWEDVVRTTEFEELVPSADVYFGTDPCQIMLLSEDLSAPLCEPGPLDCGTIYYWRVVKKNICGEQWGPIWSFRTYPTGDFDQDCTVDLEDFARLAEVWMAGSCEAGNGWCSGGDLSQNGQVDPSDLERFLRHWLEASQP